MPVVVVETPKQLSAPKDKTAISAIINGKITDIQADGIKWFGSASIVKVYKQSFLKAIGHKLSLSNADGSETYAIYTPVVKVINHIQVPESYNYSVFKNLLSIGKKDFFLFNANSTIPATHLNDGGYSISCFSDNKTNPDKSFFGDSMFGEQSKSIVEIVEVTEITPAVLSIKYKIEAKLYDSKGNYKTDFKGFFQVVIAYEDILT